MWQRLKTMWLDTACILFTCVTANHLGLIYAIEEVTGIRLPVVNCCKCFTFWSVLSLWFASSQPVAVSFAVSFLSAYLAVWLELAEGYIDYIYNKVYEKIYDNTENDTLTTTRSATDTNG